GNGEPDGDELAGRISPAPPEEPQQGERRRLAEVPRQAGEVEERPAFVSLERLEEVPQGIPRFPGGLLRECGADVKLPGNGDQGRGGEAEAEIANALARAVSKRQIKGPERQDDEPWKGLGQHREAGDRAHRDG